MTSVYEKAYHAAAQYSHEQGYFEYESTFLTLIQNIQNQKAAHEQRAANRATSISYGSILNATSEYTSLLLNAIDTRSIVCIVAAICPCSRLYGFIGQSIQSLLPDHDHLYSEWISTYADPKRTVFLLSSNYP